MLKTTKAIQLKNLFNKTTNIFSNSNLRDIFANKTDTKTTSIKFPLLFKLNDDKIKEKKKNIFLFDNHKINKKNKINTTFYSIKKQVNYALPRTQSDFNRSTKNKFEHIRFKNIFHSDTFENIRKKIYYNEFSKELHEKNKNYNKLLFNLIKKNKDSKKGELNIKMNVINEIEKNIIKGKKEKQKKHNNKILKAFKSYNYINFKHNMNKSLERQNVIDKKIRGILDNIENKFDNIFMNVMDKKYTLNQINQIRVNDNNKNINIEHILSDIKIKI